MTESEKAKLTLSVNSKIVEKAKKDPNINISEITETVLRAFTTSSKTDDSEKIYESYQGLFKTMLPLLKKFKVETKIATKIHQWIDPEPKDYDDEGTPIDWTDLEPTEWWDYYLLPNGKILRDMEEAVKIKNIPIEDFHKPQHIIDEFLNAIQDGVDYRKEQFTQIEMAKTIIDVITKGVISKAKTKRAV